MKEYEIVPLQPEEDSQHKIDLILIEKDTANFRGVGNFCGWYGAEFYSNFRLIACLDDDLETPIKRTTAEIYHGEVQIQSVYRNTIIQAENDDEAFEKFKEHIRSLNKE